MPSSRGGSRILAALIGIAVSLALAELLLRMLGIGNPLFHRADATFGSVLIPGASGWQANEGRAYVSINGDGLRDVEHDQAKPPDTVRIAVLGDSYAEAMQVPVQEAFWWVLGKRLGDCEALAGKAIEMINFGVNGYGTAQEYLVLQKRVWAYHPDAVLLAFTTGNDVADNHPRLGASNAPFYRLEGKELVLDSSRAYTRGTARRTMHWLIRHLRVLQVIDRVWNNWRTCRKLGACNEDVDLRRGEPGLHNEVYLEPSDDTWRQAWGITEALLRRIRDEVAAHGARFLLVTLSNAIQVHPDPDVTESFRRGLGAANLFYPDERIAAFAEREGIPVLNLAPQLLHQARQNHLYLHGWKDHNLGSGHWNSEGHRLAAETLAPWLCRELGAAHSDPR